MHVIFVSAIVALVIGHHIQSTLIIALFEAMGPVSVWGGGILNYVFSGFGSGKIYPNTTAYVTLLYCTMALAHGNFLVRYYQRLRSCPLILEEERMNFSQYMCKYFYSDFHPVISFRCWRHAYEKDESKLKLERQSTHVSAVGKFLRESRNPGLLSEYTILICIGFIALPLGIGFDKSPERIGFLPLTEMLLFCVYVQVNVVSEIVALVIASRIRGRQK